MKFALPLGAGFFKSLAHLYFTGPRGDFYLSDWIKFLGTAGARFVVYKQLRASGGVWCRLQGQNILIDPGPGTVYRCHAAKPKLNPEELDAVILTHRHLDHTTDANVVIEAMTQGGFKQRGALFAPDDALCRPEPVVFDFLRKAVERLALLVEGGSYQLAGVEFSTPVRHLHPVETYGLIFNLPYGRIGFIVDTAFFPELLEHYQGVDLLVLNLMLYDPPTAPWIQHLDFGGARSLIEGIKPQVTVITHFGMTLLKRNPHLVAEQLQEETGSKVIAARDGLTLDLESLFT
jgi:phosphoribosyl 1,2-cyclic phosphodiesterase